MFVASGVGPFSGQSPFPDYAPDKIAYAITVTWRRGAAPLRHSMRRLAKHKYLLGEATWRAPGLGTPHSHCVWAEDIWVKFPNLKRLVDEISARLVARRACRQGQAQVQDRVRRGSQEGHVQAHGREGRLMNSGEQKPKGGGRRRLRRTPKSQVDPAALDEVRALLTDRPRRCVAHRACPHSRRAPRISRCSPSK